MSIFKKLCYILLSLLLISFFYGCKRQKSSKLLKITYKDRNGNKKSTTAEVDHNGDVFFEGDIIVGNIGSLSESELGLKLTTLTSAYPWIAGIVPFQIDSSVNSNLQNLITAAISYFNDNTAIRLITIQEANNIGYSTLNTLTFFQTSNRCFSNTIGMRTDAEIRCDPNGFDTASMIHEIMHVLGFEHEQMNPNAPGLVIRRDRIQTGMESQYFDTAASALTAYDQFSIMHYSSYGFTLCNAITDPKWSDSALDLPDPRCRQASWGWWHATFRSPNVDCMIECATMLLNGNTIDGQRDSLTARDVEGLENYYSIPTSVNRTFRDEVYRQATVTEMIANVAAIIYDRLTINQLQTQLHASEEAVNKRSALLVAIISSGIN